MEVVELDERARRTLARRHPELAGYDNALVVAARPDLCQPVGQIIEEIARRANDGEDLAREDLVDVLAAEIIVAKPELIETARRQAVQRGRILTDFGALTASQLAEANGSTAGKRSQIAYRWRKEGRIFGVRHARTVYYLGFQFDESGEPLPVIREILEHLATWDPWDIAVWFVQPHAMLDHHSPVDRPDDPTAVIAAAMHDAARRGR